MTRAFAVLAGSLVALALGGCPHHGPPTGPPPEYERPVLPPWEAAAPAPPAGEEVDEPDEPTQPVPQADAAPGDASDAAAGDAGPAR